MAFNFFAPPSKDDIKVGYIDPTFGYVNGVTICEANEYAKNNPGTTFIFRDGDNSIRYLSINEVNQLTPSDLIPSNENCEGIQKYKECGPPRIQFFGGGGIGAVGNPVIGRDGSLLAVDIVSGGHGYEYPPIVAARDDCQFGNGAVLTAVLGETADQTEVYEGEEDFEEYEICEDTDVGYGLRYGPNGEELGPWEPSLYTRIGEDPIRREIELFQRLLEKPFWTTRKAQPDRINTPEKEYQDAYQVTHPDWGEFMNEYAVSPIQSSDFIGSDEASQIFTMEWEQNFPITGEYIFRGVCDETAQVYIDDGLVGDLKGPKDNPSPLQKTIQEGNHIIRVNLSNSPATTNVNSDFIDVQFSIKTDGGDTSRSYKCSFVSEDGSHTFTLTPFPSKDLAKTAKIETIKVKPGVKYKIVPSNPKLSQKGIEQGLTILSLGSKFDEKKVNVGRTAPGIFFDTVRGVNDNNDFQVVASVGSFYATNQRKLPNSGRDTFDLSFGVDTDQTNNFRKIISPKSWNENPMGVSMLIEAPVPPPPKENLPEPIGECPRNPFWTTRFPSIESQQWYPVRYYGLKKIVQETSPSAPETEPETEPETQEVEFKIFGSGTSGYIKDISFIFTSVDGQHTFELKNVQKSGKTKTEKIQIRKNVNYVVQAKEDSSKYKKVEQGLIKQGTKDNEGGIGESNKIFADFIGSGNDNDDMQITTNLGKFISSNKRKPNRTTYDLTYVFESAPGGNQNVTNPIEKVYDIPGWSQFMNRYAISPVLPLNTPGSDISGVSFSNSWELNLPYAGFYGLKGTGDNSGRILIDGKEIIKLEGSDVSNPKLTKVSLTKGRHIITTEIFNDPVEINSVIDTKIFSTQDWRVGGVVNSDFIDVQFSIKTDGSDTSRSYKCSFVSEDESHTFTLTPFPSKDLAKTAKIQTIKVKPGVKYKIVPINTLLSQMYGGKSRASNLIEQGLTRLSLGSKFDESKERGVKTAPGIFFDTVSGVNDNNDFQVVASVGSFYATNQRKLPNSGRDTFDLSFGVDPMQSTQQSNSGNVVSGTVKDNVTYEGPEIFGYQNSVWSEFMNNYSVSPKVFSSFDSPDDRVVGKYTLTWKGVNFPQDGLYKFNLQGDSVATLKVGGTEILRVTDFQGQKVQYNFNISKGIYDVVLEVDNLGDPTYLKSINANPYVFSTNPMGVSLYISKDVIFTDSNKTPWKENPIGVSAILIPPPCAKKIGGKGVVEKVIVEDPGNGYLPPDGPGYPVKLILEEIIVENPGINYRCGEDEIKIFPDNGAKISYSCDPFGRITNPKVEIPGNPITVYPTITIPSETGVNATFRPVFRVIRDPLLPPDKIIQVTDLVGLKQTGYVDGRAYYGAIYYDNGIPYAGYYKTAGPQTRVYATLQESITARVTTPPSAIQRSGTDIRSNDPRLNIPGTIQDTTE